MEMKAIGNGLLKFPHEAVSEGLHGVRGHEKFKIFHCRMGRKPGLDNTPDKRLKFFG